jgi:hypothetical protein
MRYDEYLAAGDPIGSGSMYFREPGGVLFEIATDTPSFTADEAAERFLMPPADVNGSLPVTPPPVSVSLRNALWPITTRQIAPAGCFVIPHGHKDLCDFCRLAAVARLGTRPARKRRDTPFSSLFGPFLSDSSGLPPKSPQARILL